VNFDWPIPLEVVAIELEIDGDLAAAKPQDVGEAPAVVVAARPDQ